jgi:hypothetical protein
LNLGAANPKALEDSDMRAHTRVPVNGQGRGGAARRAAVLAAGLALGLAAAASARVQFDVPPTQPGAPTVDDSIVAHLIVPIACREPEFVVARIDTAIDLRYQPPIFDCPLVPSNQQRSVVIGSLPAGAYLLRVSNVLSASPVPDDQVLLVVAPSACEPDPAVPPAEQAAHTLCIGGRFTVTAEWTAHDGSHGFGTAMPLTAESGAFWFFHPDNLELMVKVLDACSYNQRSWVFAAGLTDVGVVLRVYDKLTRLGRSYTSLRGQPFLPVTDVNAT